VLSFFSKPSPEDSLWLAILELEPSLRRLSPTQAQEELKMAGFPRRLVKAYLEQRKTQKLPLAVESGSAFSSPSSS
jgi:hypothetical protein